MSKKRSYGTGSIFERKWSDGSVWWYGRWRRADGTRAKPVKLGLKRTAGYADGLTKAQAEAKLRAEIETDRQQMQATPARRGHTLGQAADGWIEHLEAKGKSPTYLQDARSALKHHVLSYFAAHADLASIDLAACQQFVRHLEALTSPRTGKKLSKKSIHNYAGALTGPLAYAVQRHWLAANPAQGLILPALIADDGVVEVDEVMWADDVQRLIAAARPGAYQSLDRALYGVAAMAGLRKGECLGLRWANVDLAARRIRVFEQLARGDQRRAPKGKRGRSVPMSAPVVEALTALRNTSQWTADDDPVFADPFTGQRVAWTPTRRRYIAALKVPGLGTRFSRFHDLRHTFASELARAGTAERSIQEWCGHASPAVTRRYMHFSPASDADLAAVDAAFGTGAPVAKLTVAA